jgi:ABC-type siderophore export system fused ATPase/permease subunit
MNGNHEMKWEKELTYLWDEYKYRHDLVWRVALRLTFVVASLSVVPYVNDTLTTKMGHLMLVPPIVAVVLAVFGSAVIINEYCLLATIKNAYHRLQAKFFEQTFQQLDDGGTPTQKTSTHHLFPVFLGVYLFCLVVLAIMNLAFIFLGLL